MSSTSIVIKCLSDTKSTNTPHGAITIGTLILQARARLASLAVPAARGRGLCCALPGVCRGSLPLPRQPTLPCAAASMTPESPCMRRPVLPGSLCGLSGGARRAGLHGGPAVRVHARAGGQPRGGRRPPGRRAHAGPVRRGRRPGSHAGVLSSARRCLRRWRCGPGLSCFARAQDIVGVRWPAAWRSASQCQCPGQ